jgi:4'-phosphopantetheinyl transferase
VTALAAGAWAAPRVLPRLEGDDVHVWLAAVDQPLAGASVLADDERARADRFCFERDRRQFSHCRTILRRLLASYLAADPRTLTFAAGVRGKPRLAAPRDRALAFNVSHSGGFALIGISRRADLGVDIEAQRPLADRDLIAQQYFSPRECARLASLPPALRTPAFFTCWSRKEAYVKAIGDGLACPLDNFAVTFAPGEPVRIDVPDNAREWTLEALDAPAGYAAALVTEGRRRVSCWQWNACLAEEKV